MSQLTRVLQSTRCVLGGREGPLRIEPARITVRGSLISQVDLRDDGAPPDAATDVEFVDFGDRLLSPAFINGHTHLSMTAFRGIGGVEVLGGNVIEDLYYQLEAALEPEAVRAFSRVSAYESLLSGVGLVWDHYYHGSAVAAALGDVGLAGVVAPTLQDVKGPGVRSWQEQIDATLTIDQSSRGSRGTAAIAAALGPHATDTVSESGWSAIAELATAHALPIHVHVAQSHLEYQRSLELHSLSPVAALSRMGMLDGRLRMLLVHAILLDRRDLELLDPRVHVLGFCPFSQMQFCYPADAPAWTEAGLPWLVATDCVPSNDSMNVQKELRLVAGLRGFETSHSEAVRVFQSGGDRSTAEAVERERMERFGRRRRMADPDFLLSRVWSVPGDLHPRLRAGVLEPERLANIVIWDLEHPSFWPADDPLRALAMSDTTGAIHGMMVAGEWIGRRGDFHRSLIEDGSYGEAYREADQRLRAHLGRLGLPNVGTGRGLPPASRR